ncbi:hypothetical protein BHE74_00043084 [Ensete ventricosum]|nr:hypothetical protein BHE74_00043084 [Ensete ventricosum]
MTARRLSRTLQMDYLYVGVMISLAYLSFTLQTLFRSWSCSGPHEMGLRRRRRRSSSGRGTRGFLLHSVSHGSAAIRFPSPAG